MPMFKETVNIVTIIDTFAGGGTNCIEAYASRLSFQQRPIGGTTARHLDDVVAVIHDIAD